MACVCLRVRADDRRGYRVGAARGTRCARRCHGSVALGVTEGWVRVNGNSKCKMNLPNNESPMPRRPGRHLPVRPVAELSPT